MKNIEVELRGPLTKEKFLELETFLKEKGKFKTSRKRLLIDYSTEAVRNRNSDIRLRVTNGIPEIIIKIGKWGGIDNRKELSFEGKRGEFDKLVQIFAALGLTKGILAIRNSQVYEYKEIEFALVEVPNHSYYFEAERLVHEGENFDEVKKEIQEVCVSLGLTLFNDQEFFDYVEQLNQEANKFFDFNNYQEGYFERLNS